MALYRELDGMGTIPHPAGQDNDPVFLAAAGVAPTAGRATDRHDGGAGHADGCRSSRGTAAAARASGSAGSGLGAARVREGARASVPGSARAEPSLAPARAGGLDQADNEHPRPEDRGLGQSPTSLDTPGEFPKNSPGVWGPFRGARGLV